MKGFADAPVAVTLPKYKYFISTSYLHSGSTTKVLKFLLLVI